MIAKRKHRLLQLRNASEVELDINERKSEAAGSVRTTARDKWKVVRVEWDSDLEEFWFNSRW